MTFNSDVAGKIPYEWDSGTGGLTVRRSKAARGQISLCQDEGDYYDSTCYLTRNQVLLLVRALMESLLEGQDG